MHVPEWLSVTIVVVDLVIKVVAVGVVPENRRPSSSMAWLLIILFLPIVGLPLFLVLGSNRASARRHRIQERANARLAELTEEHPADLGTIDLPDGVRGLVRLGRNLTEHPMVLGRHERLLTDYTATLAAMTEAVQGAQVSVSAQFYIFAWDDATDPFVRALAAAARRGVTVRVLMDHLGSFRYARWRELRRFFRDEGVQCHLMMPIQPLRGRWRRPDLRNHRKILVVDGERGFTGSLNVIDASYHTRDRVWTETMVELTGPIVTSLEAVFATDWYAESGEALRVQPTSAHAPVGDDPRVGAFQLIPSGPGYTSEPSLRLFTALLHRAERSAAIVSPYFVPDESLLSAITTAAYRGVAVDLYVSEKSDHVWLDHAQASYYRVLLDAGVRIWCYATPGLLHSKFTVVDGQVAVIGTANMDMRSFGLNYEVTVLGVGGELAAELEATLTAYRQGSSELTSAAWGKRVWWRRYLDNVLRLTSALQ